MKKLLTLVLSVFLLQTSFSQLTTTINPTIAQMTSVLQGNGVVVTNVTRTCPTGATGGSALFSGGASALGGLNSGILLTTGTASNVAGPSVNTTGNNLSYDAGAPGSSLGNGLAGGTTFDGCYISFLITPNCSTLSLSYVFASEEYPEWVGSTYNDVFGFLISGPNPSGPVYNNKNLAMIPGTSTPVTINNVNATSNSSYYLQAPPGLEYDGRTTVLTASTSVVPCQTYTMTIGVWDDGDGNLDSGVFLDVNGLSCLGSPTITAAATPSTLCASQTITLTAGGGIASGTYTWTGPASGGLSGATGPTVTANPTASTTYTVLYSDVNTCPGVPLTEMATVTFTTLPPFTVTKSPAGNICSGQSATLTANGGAGTYSWTAGTGLSATTGSVVVASPTTTTTYTVVKSVGSCTVASVVTVSVSPPITVAITPTLATICTGQTATLVASGGTTYTWTASSGTNPPSTATVTVTPGSTTTYTVKGATGTCTSQAVATVSITSAPSVTVTPVSTNICSGQSATLTATGGAAPYNWTASSGANPASGSTAVVSPTGTTTYTVISGSGTCTASAVSTVSITSIPTITLTPANTSICTGQSATLTVAGGSAPYVWTASSGTNPPNGSTAVVSPTATTSYTVMSGSGTCTAIAVSNVSITTAPTVSISPASTMICSGQSVTLTTSGGAAPYNWTASSGTNPAPGTTAVVSPTTTTTYSVLSGSGTCTASAVADVSVTPNFSVTVTPSITTICPGTTGTLVASGGTNYTWLPGLNNTATLTANPSSTTTYTIIGTTGPCTNSTTATMSVNIVSTSVTATSNTYCVGGASVTLTGSGATTYSWDPPFGLSGTSGTSVTASPTLTTTYTVTGTTGACSSTATVTITVPAVVTLSATATSTLICAGTSATLSAAGASTYTWLPGATSGSTINVTPPTATNYTLTGQTSDGCVTIPATITINVDPVVSLTVTPSNTTICNGTGGTTLTVSGATTYTWVADASLSSTSAATVTANPTITTTYSVTGQSGVCSNSATATVSVITVNTAVAASSNTYCVGGASVTLTASGATTYSWDPPAGLSSTSGTTVTASPTVTTTYTLTGSTGACNSTTVVTITVPPTVTLSIAATNTLLCPATNATLTASGANTYTWLPGSATTSTLDVSPAATTDYTVTGLTSDGCVTVPSTITINVAPAIVLTVTPSNTAICNGSGSASLTVSGATNYTWSPANGLSNPNSGTVTANPTVTTTYSIIGATGSCTSSATATVSVITVSTAVAASSNSYCVGGASVTLTASGATTYSWSPPTGLSSTSGATVTASPTLTTTYTLTGSTGACNSTTVVTITVPPLVSLSITPTSTVICLNGPGTSLVATGANTYTWLPGSSNSSTLAANPIATTNYTVLGQTSQGCYAIPAVQTVSVSAPITPTITGSPTVCLTQTTGLVVAPSAAGLTYTWSPSAAIQGAVSNSSISALPPSTATVIYTVIVSNGVCTGTDTAKLVVRTPPTGNFKPLNSNTICIGTCVTFSSTTTGSQPITYNWYYENGVGTSSVGPHPEACYFGPSGSFAVTMVATNACGTDSLIKDDFVIVFAKPSLTVHGDTTINIGETATVYASGATVYSWAPDIDGSIACTSCSSTVVSPTVTTDYIVTAYDSPYCKSYDTVTVVVDVNCGDFFIPNVFSPNDDGLNDVINVHGRCISTFNLQIFDRWGEKVFETSSLTDSWDGTYRGQKMNTGVFVYKADGVSIDGQSFSLKGNITLIR